MTRPIALALALLAAAPSRGDERYDEVRRQAEPVEGLGRFLERYVGSCGDPTTRADCERNVRQARKALQGRTFLVTVGEQTLTLVRPEWLGNRVRYLITPFVDGGGLALSHGEPGRQDAAGRPLIGYLGIERGVPPGGDELSLQQAFRTGRVDMEIVFRPEGVWKLRRKREPGFYEGVRARFLAIRLLDGRTGEEIASKVF